MTSVPSAALGFCVGFLPIVVFYALNGGFESFYNESFVEIQEIVTRRYRAFSFSDADSLGSAFTMTRRVGLFGAPLFAVALGIALGLSRMRREPGGSSAIVLILNSTVLSTMYLGLYPNPNRVQILFLAPMIMLPFVYGLSLFLKTRVKGTPTRVALILAFLVAPVVVYFGGRYISETPHEAASTEIALLDGDRGNIYLPRWVVDYVSPVTNYLRTRPAEETFLGYDVYNKAMAFLAGRRAEADYFQRHQFREVGDSDIREIRKLAEDQKIDTIILGKSFLPGTEAEKELFSYLAQQYRLVLNTENHLGYQRAQNLKGR
jgi:nucleotide-binding universal stress UspA family protein